MIIQKNNQLIMYHPIMNKINRFNFIWNKDGKKYFFEAPDSINVFSNSILYLYCSELPNYILLIFNSNDYHKIENNINNMNFKIREYSGDHSYYFQIKE
jgi:hypothetical protein